MSEARADRAILLLGIASVAASASLRATDPLLAGLALEFATSPGRAAAATTAFFLGYGLLQFVHGPMGDRFGKVQVVCAQAALAAVATLVCALAPSLDALIAARFVSGFFIGAVIPLTLAWIGDVIAYERRQAVMARVIVGQVSGSMIGLAAGGWFAEHLGWRWSFVSIAVCFGAAAILLAFELRSNPLHARAGEGPPRKRPGMLALLADPWVRVMLATVFFEAMLVLGAVGYLPLHLHRSLGLGMSASGLLVALFPLGGLVYALAASKLVPRLGERGLVSYGGAGAGLTLLAVALAPNAVIATAAIFLMGLGMYMMHGTIQVHATQMAPEARGAGVTTFALFLFLGQSIGTWLGALVVDGFGTLPIFLVSAAGVWLLTIGFLRKLAQRGTPAGPARAP